MAQLIGSGANQVPVNGMLGTAAFVDKEQLPVSDPQQVALNLKANLASPALTDTPTAPTAAVGTNTTQIATTAFVNAEIANDAVVKTSATGSAQLPSGTTAQRDVSPTFGATRANSTLNQTEWFNGTAWVSMGGGATGAPGNNVFVENDQTVTASYTLTAGKNAMTAGPVSINDGVVVTIPTGATWSII